jgi:hypothetical protein
MRELDKKITLATAFETWYNQDSARPYHSSRYPYYDVLYELLIIQDGLCAYTELRLIDPENLEKLKNGFVDGKYTADYKPDVPAQIEHFSKARKITCGWDFNNLFGVYDRVNLLKNHLENKYGADEILKPDSENYSSQKYLMYDKEEHIFFPNINLDRISHQKVSNMIIVLGLNNDYIKMTRKNYIEMIKALEEYSEVKQTVTQFHTAYSMM